MIGEQMLKFMDAIEKQIENLKRNLNFEEIERAIGYVPNGTILPTSESLVELRQLLRAEYDEIGYPEAQATLRLETTEDPGKVALVVEVAEGMPERYTKIRLPGLPPDHPKRPLLRKIELKQETPRNAETVAEALEKLNSELSSWGYLDSKIGKPTERRIGKYAFELTIPIEPGIHTDVVFTGNRRLMKRTLMDRLEGKGQLRSTPRGAQLAVDRLRAIYRKEGLFHARIEPPENDERRSRGREVAMHRTVDAYSAAKPPPPKTELVEISHVGGGDIGPAGGGAPRRPKKRETPKVGRNDPCPCGSGKKYKKCCGRGE